ncbi:MAG: class I poly(R)-hydroxyalkanoic acid synthase [Rickettsiales bacterium]|nr:class I poly(R)-hydroxyalkanoic acid synthase [Rickettsiales bacterium]
MKNDDGYNNEAFLRNMEKATQLWPQVLEKFSSFTSDSKQTNDPLSQEVTQAFLAFQNSLLQQSPDELAKAGFEWWTESLTLGQKQFQQFLSPSEKASNEVEKDRRFRSDLWSANPFYENLKEQYKLTSKLIDSTLDKANDNLDDRSAHLVEFYGKQWRDALSPSNYPWTNPEVLNHAIETNGESIIDGLENLMHDLEQGRITMTPKDAFTLGKDIATTPGKVVYENELMQLIQYEAATDKVQKTPLLITPAWINKYYILDLQPENSLVKWLTDQGFTVFMISWVNPDKEHQNIDFDDYLMLGAWEAVQTVLKLTGAKKLHITGYCLGGTLTSCLLAWLEAKGKADCIASATFLTTMVDFEKAGDLKIFTEESQLHALEERLEERGYLEGNEMAAIFNALRPQDLIWSFVVSNYLMGKTPLSFDLLYWNGDVTGMPAKMHLFYLREMYLNNSLAQNKLTLSGEKIEPSCIKTPSYMISAQDDHIAPWRATYASTQLYKGETRFILSGSGHIGGVVNPPYKKKYGWRSADSLPAEASEWLEKSVQHEGSWWDDWADWLRSQSDESIPARQIKESLEDAPGSYVKVRV